MWERLGVSRGRVVIGGAVALVVGAVAISPAIGGPGFLTKKKASKIFAKKDDAYTKADADARFLTPSQGDSRYLTPGQGDSRYLPASGQIRVNASPMTWQKTSGAPGIDTLPERPEPGFTTFGGSSMALSDVPVAIEPTLPTVLVGKPLTFVGVNACYVTDPITTLDTVRINLTTNTNGSGNTSALLTDTIDRTDDACRDYTPTTPHPLAPGDDISLEFAVDYSANAGFFGAGRATFILQP
jgi:hypothetical protein